MMMIPWSVNSQSLKDQDPSEQGKKVVVHGDSEIWMKNLSNGQKAVILLNRAPENSASIFPT